MKTVLMVAAGVVVGFTVVIAVLVQILVQLAPILVAVAAAVLVLRLVRSRRPRQNDVQVLPPRAAPWTPTYVAPTPQAPVPAPRAAALPTSAAPVEDLYLRWGTSESEDLDSVRAFTPRAALPQGRRARAGSRPTGNDRGRRP